jgi:hypothetical protein
MSLFTRSKMVVAFSSALVLAQFACAGFAEEASGGNNPPPSPTPIQQVDTAIDQRKLSLAKALTDWMQTTLLKEKTLVAVVARKGGEDVKKHDKTGMAHSGLAVYDPRAQTWLIYNLVQDTKTAQDQPGPATESIWRTAPLDFYYGQTGYDEDALILIPDLATQQRVYEAMVSGDYKKLTFTSAYNLLSPYDSLKSFNCNKWLLFNLAAARIDNYDPPAVAQAIHAGFVPGKIYFSPLENFFVRHKPNVLLNELPPHPPIETVTVESLYRSNLFPKKVFYSGKKEL